MKPIYTAMRVSQPDWTRVPAVRLEHTGWLKSCPVEAKAQACHNGENLWVRMEAEETLIRATLTGRLDAVCTDSCLEFFLAPFPDDSRYFNFEFNPLGTLYLGFGGERATRIRQIVRSTETSFGPKPFFTEEGWGIEFHIPLSFLRVFFPGASFSGKMHCNFYKCGDLTEMPHYLAWSPLTSETPDYHRRQDFGILCLGE